MGMKEMKKNIAIQLPVNLIHSSVSLSLTLLPPQPHDNISYLQQRDGNSNWKSAKTMTTEAKQNKSFLFLSFSV
jgi:hypothetical protein